MHERKSNDNTESSPGTRSIHTEIRMDSKVSSGKKKSKSKGKSPDKSNTKISKRSRKSNSPEQTEPTPETNRISKARNNEGSEVRQHKTIPQPKKYLKNDFLPDELRNA